MMTLDNVIELFVSSDEKKLQLDFFRENGQVLMQVYKYENVINWGIGIDFGQDEGYVIEVCFSNSKTNNKENFSRFSSSDLISCFTSFKEVGPKSYFTFFELATSNREFVYSVSNILHTVYGEDVKVLAQVNAY